MEPLSRRALLRASAGASGLAGASLVGAGLFEPSSAGFPRIEFFPNRTHFEVGETMKLTLKEEVRRPLHVRASDSSGTVWRKTFKNDRRQVWVATATKPGTGVVTIVMKRSDGRVFRRAVAYTVGTVAAPPAKPIIGMSAPADAWAERAAAVGGGIAARRIYADLAAGYLSQMKSVEQAHADGMLPVISYKVGGDVAGAVNGAYNAVAEQAAAKLASYGKPTSVSFWHEPNKDLSPADHVAASKQILPYFKRGELKVGPILNGFLLDNQVDTFAAFTPDEMFGIWDYVGIDTYEGGTADNPGPRKPADRIYGLRSYLSSRGYTHPIAVGEYNGYSAATIAAAGEALLTTPSVWFGICWNASADVDWVLSGDRLAAFQGTLADPRAADPRTA
jgi:hypothetical protein